MWLHAASVGEVLSILPLIDAIRNRWPDMSVIVTTVTVTSAKILTERAIEGVIHQYAPLDHQSWLARFMEHWRPTCVLWIESEFWPNTICMIKDRQIPLILVNGRVSPKSFARWKRYRAIISGMLGRFDACFAQSETDARYLRELGAQNVSIVGNLKQAAPPLSADPVALHNLIGAINGRPCWMLSSSHPGEEAIALTVHISLLKRYPHLLTIIVPRHPDRGDEIARAASAAGLSLGQRSKGELPDTDTNIYIADTVGEMGVLYRACPFVVMGKSILEPGGGQNPYEPAKVGCAVMFGPHMENFVDLSADMLDRGAAKQFKDSNELNDLIAMMLDQPDLVKTQIDRAIAYCAQADTIIEDTISAIAPYVGTKR